MLPKKETTILYMLVIIAIMVVVFSKNPSAIDTPNHWGKCSKNNRPHPPYRLHLPITDAILKYIV